MPSVAARHLIRLSVVALSAMVALPTPEAAAQSAFVVNATTDESDADTADGVCATEGGACTLRAAIEQAAANAGRDSIAFDLPGTGPHVIAPQAPLDGLFEVVVDGYTQAGARPATATSAAVLQIVLDGGGAGYSDGLILAGATVRGLAIRSFQRSGIELSAFGEDNVVEGCDLGLNGGNGILVASSGNRIGGRTPVQRNVISANDENGIELRYGENNVIEGNYVGVGADGVSALGNRASGVAIVNPGDNRIGGAEPGAGNVISDNLHGIHSRSVRTGTVIQGNRIGTTADGASALGNTLSGIFMDGAREHRIGGTGPGAGNVISGNEGHGVEIFAADVDVVGNLIGVAADGTTPLGNLGSGVHISTGGGSTIGGEQAGAGNVIAHNGESGIVAVDTPGFQPHGSFLGNAIYGNGSLGIDLGGDGVTANDDGDVDDGANGLQNFPVITAVETIAGGQVRIAGFVTGPAGTPHRLEFFGNERRDASGYGEGQTFLGAIAVTTDAEGYAGFELQVPAAMARNVTATATSQATTTGSTSEFSGRPQHVVNSTNTHNGDIGDARPGDGFCDTGFTIPRGPVTEPECTLRAALEEANAGSGPVAIVFDIPAADDGGCDGVGVCTVRPADALPAVARPMTIDGGTQPGARANGNPVGQGLNAALRIVLAGDGQPAGLHLSGGGATVRGLVIHGFDVGILVDKAGGNVVEGCVVGADVTGTARRVNDEGIHIDGTSDNRIGGAAPGARNLVSGNGKLESGGGIRISGGGTRNQILGNLIGTDGGGRGRLHNAYYGIEISGAGTNDNVVADNLISANGTADVRLGTHCVGAGLRIDDGAARNRVEGNAIGTDVSRQAQLGNLNAGVCVASAGINNLILDNTISGNGTSGIEITSGDGLTPTKRSEDTDVAGNRIGTDGNGVRALPNRSHGIDTSSPTTLVRDNLISGNGGRGVYVHGSLARQVRFLGNAIGTDAARGVALPNGAAGIEVRAAPEAVIGGGAGQVNTISGNGGPGIHLRDADGARVHNNRVGTDEGTTRAVPNQGHGVHVEGGEGVTLGGPGADDANVISGNDRYGVYVTKARELRVEGNLIGPAARVPGAALPSLPNGSGGMAIEGASGVTVQDNSIGDNRGAGVWIRDGRRNRLLGNRIFGNHGLRPFVLFSKGIDLGLDGLLGATTRDAGDPDEGANRLQNAPEVIRAEIDPAGELVIRFRVDSAPTNATYPLLLEVFEADRFLTQGRRPLGRDVYPADLAGQARRVSLGDAAGLGIAPGAWLVATATDDSGNTSEFGGPTFVHPADGTALLDFGDAPRDPPVDTSVPFGYPVSLADDGARHAIVEGVHLGTGVDAEADAQANPRARGDDNDGAADEDGLRFGTGWRLLQARVDPDAFDRRELIWGVTPGTTVSLTPLASVDGHVDAWIDVNGDGDWDDAGERVLASPVRGAPDYTELTLDIPGQARTGWTFLRVRFSRQGGLAADGPAADGEVEDRRIAILPATALDFGDAPAPYATRAADGGPFHAVGDYYLGTAVDAEADGQPAAAADSDSADDGVVFLTALTPDDSAAVAVTATAPAGRVGILDGWLDFNGDGDWDDVGEHIVRGALLAGSQRFDFPVPAHAAGGDTFARFRFGQAPVTGPHSGGAADPLTTVIGEVEDHAVTIEGVVTAVVDEPAVPSTSRLWASYPNPFNPTTTIAFELAAPAPVVVEVYDLAGQRVRRLVDADFGAGRHEVRFDGAGLASGVYLCVVHTRTFRAVGKMMLVR